MTVRNPEFVQILGEITHSLVGDFDLFGLLQQVTVHGARILGVDAVGLMLTGPRGDLVTAAASNEKARVLELFQIQIDEGPCLDCVQSGRNISYPDVTNASDRWPRFVPRALDAGFVAVHAIPMRPSDSVVGGMNIFDSKKGSLREQSVLIARTLTDMATIALLQERAIRDGEMVAEQLRVVLNARLAVEQAKGIIAEQLQMDVTDAYEIMQAYSRHRTVKMTDLAVALVSGDLSAVVLTSDRPAHGID